MKLKMVLPKGRINNQVKQLLSDCGIELLGSDRNYRPQVRGCNLQVKLLKSQNIPTLVDMGQHDLGFAGWDWVVESRAKVEKLKDLKFDPVKIVACIPKDLAWTELKKRPLIVASEYQNISTQYLQSTKVNFKLIRSYGATEVFPPEDADMIIDNCSTGTTIRENQLKIVDTIMSSTTQLIANPNALNDTGKRQDIENILTLINSVINARVRVLIEMNCSEDNLESIVNLLPAMRFPTVSTLYQAKGFAVKAAIPSDDIQRLIPKLISAGATDILETPIRKAI